MNEDKIYENLVLNSIGREKKVKKMFNLKKVTLKVSLPILLSTIMSISLSGCNSNKSVKTKSSKTSQTETISSSNTKELDINLIMENYSQIYENYGITAIDINTYERQRLFQLLKKYKMNNYTMVNGKRDYHYKISDYAKIKELDDNYLYTFHYIATYDSLLKMVNSMGYDNLNDYLIKNKYVDSNGKASLKIWGASNSLFAAQKIKKNSKQKELIK